LAGLVAVNIGAVVGLIAGDVAPAGSSALYAAGNALFLGSALTLIMRQGRKHLGSIVDTAIIAFALGGLLWNIVLEPDVGGFYDAGVPEANLFLAVLALCGVLGALARLVQLKAASVPALRLLIAAFVFALTGYILGAIAGDGQTSAGWLRVASVIMFLAVYTNIGLFGLDPSAPKLTRPEHAQRGDALSVGRLVFLGMAVAAIPIVGAHEILGDVDGLLLVISITIIVVLVMCRIYGLSAERDRLARALAHEASHDPLTGLPNRRKFVARLKAELSQPPDCVILFCDLDRFKAVNDQLGHEAGDALLVESAQRLRACVRESDMVSRFGGDEFLILLHHPSPAEVETICDRIAETLSRPFDLQAERMTIGASIGIADSAGTTDPEDLIKRADAAMYAAKRDQPVAPGVRRR
jgi:diguanylate cyclase (GGDEF)-like protein